MVSEQTHEVHVTGHARKEIALRAIKRRSVHPEWRLAVDAIFTSNGQRAICARKRDRRQPRTRGEIIAPERVCFRHGEVEDSNVADTSFFVCITSHAK